MYKYIENKLKTLKSYNGISVYNKKENGFYLGISLSSDILKLIEKGCRVSDVLVRINKNTRVEVLCNISSISFKSIVGYSKVIESAYKYIKDNNYEGVLIRLEVLEIQGNLRTYIRGLEFTSFY